MDEHVFSQPPVRTFAYISTGDPVGYEQQAVSTVANLSSIPSQANKATIQPDNGDVRWRDDGVAPTASVGNYLPQLSTLSIESLKSLNAIQLVAVTGTVNVNINFYQK
ncbi:MAG: hypothetical protein KGL39_14815 [Patescibacteria group bacterium]|nr:hypothetical protein [Patescibacteria group bacterium]